MEELADADLVERTRAGDKEAFGDLIARYQPMAARLAARMVGDGDLARDCVQEAMLQAYLSLGRLQDAGRFRSWLYGIVLNICRGHLRTRKARAFSWDDLAGGLRFEAIPPGGIEPDPYEIVEALELHRRVLDAVGVLPPKIRSATLLFYYEQLSLQEIAAILGVSVAAVKSRLHQARKQLRARLLPVYSEITNGVSDERRSTKMIPVTIADVVARSAPPERHFVVVLWDGSGQRLLPIWVGPSEAMAIAMGLRNLPTDRPLTYSFIATLLDTLGATVEEVRVEALKNSTFYATVKIRRNGTVREIDARPSDAIALAGRTGSPIYVAEAVMDESAVPVPAAMAQAPLGKGAEALGRELEEQWQAMRAQTPRTPEETEQMQQEFLAFLFGAGEGEQPATE